MHVLSYSKFYKFTKEWNLIQRDNYIKVSKGDGLIQSSWMRNMQGKYEGIISVIKTFCMTYDVTEIPVSIKLSGYAGDAFTYSLPKEYHKHHLYLVKFNGIIHQCIIVDDVEYNDLKDRKLV